MTNQVKLEIDGQVAFDGEVDSVAFQRSFGTSLVATLTFAEAPAPQARSMARGGGLSAIVSAASPILQKTSENLRANAQASAQAARENAAAEEAAANPVRGRDPEA